MRVRPSRRVTLLASLVVAHVLAIGGATALGEMPDQAAAAAEHTADAAGEAVEAVEETVEGAVGQAVDVAGRPYLQPARSPALDAQPVPQHASGRFAVAPVPLRQRAAGSAGTGALTYRVEVERGLPYDAAGFAQAVDRTLSDPRGWTADPSHTFARVDSEADFRIVLASPDMVDRLCAPLQTMGRVSCRNGDDVVINALRWWRGADNYGDDVERYRKYVVNHEVGHLLGHAHEGCPRPGTPAPVMVQQTLDLDGCTANPWPTRSELEH